MLSADDGPTSRVATNFVDPLPTWIMTSFLLDSLTGEERSWYRRKLRSLLRAVTIERALQAQHAGAACWVDVSSSSAQKNQWYKSGLRSLKHAQVVCGRRMATRVTFPYQSSERNIADSKNTVDTSSNSRMRGRLLYERLARF